MRPPVALFLGQTWWMESGSHGTLPPLSPAVVPRGDALLQGSAHYRCGLQDRSAQGQGAGEQAAEEWVGARDLPQGRKLTLGPEDLGEGTQDTAPLGRVCSTLKGLGGCQELLALGSRKQSIF